MSSDCPFFAFQHFHDHISVEHKYISGPPWTNSHIPRWTDWGWFSSCSSSTLYHLIIHGFQDNQNAEMQRKKLWHHHHFCSPLHPIEFNMLEYCCKSKKLQVHCLCTANKDTSLLFIEIKMNILFSESFSWCVHSTVHWFIDPFQEYRSQPYRLNSKAAKYWL